MPGTLNLLLFKGALDWTTSTVFDFQISDVFRALVLHVGFSQSKYLIG